MLDKYLRIHEMRYMLFSAPDNCRDCWLEHHGKGIMTGSEVIKLILDTDWTLEGYELVKKEND